MSQPCLIALTSSVHDAVEGDNLVAAVRLQKYRDEFSTTDPHVAVRPSYLLALSVEDGH
jgi:hypothetical protein